MTIRYWHVLAQLFSVTALACGGGEPEGVIDAGRGSDAAFDADGAAELDAQTLDDGGEPVAASCVGEFEVTLPGHEGQFFGTPHNYCQTFVQGVSNGAFVVVGTDVAGVGDHDCTLGREVRYHVDWGDGTCEWTGWFERCDVRVGVEHTYTEPGDYLASTFGEDREGRRTRTDGKLFTVLPTGGDAYVWVRNEERIDGTLMFEQTVGLYGTIDENEITIAYRLRACDSTEVELERRVVSLPPSGDELARVATSTVEIPVDPSFAQGMLIVIVDPDEELTETCPLVGDRADPRGLNNLASVRIGNCPFLM